VELVVVVDGGTMSEWELERSYGTRGAISTEGNGDCCPGDP
jgi:hypothetical protein